MKILFSLFLMFILACSSSKEKVAVTFSYDVTFDVGFKITHKHSGIFFSDKKEIFYFGNVASAKKISFNDISGKKFFDVDLKNVKEPIDDISIISFDTILVLSEHTNHVYFLNKEGSIWKTLDLNPLLNSIDPDQKFFLMSSMYQDFVQGDVMLFRPYLIWNEKEGNKLEQFRSYHTKVNKLALICKVTDIFGSASMVFGADSIFSRFASSNEIIDDFPYFGHDNHRTVYLFSSFNDSIYIIDQKDLKIEEVFKIESKYSALKRKPISINWKTLNAYNDVLKQTYTTYGYINRFFSDKTKNLFYIVVYHFDMEPDDQIKESSLIIYDTSFKKMKEIKFDSDYIPGFSIVTKEGILIFKKTINENKIVFHNFYISKY